MDKDGGLEADFSNVSPHAVIEETRLPLGFLYLSEAEDQDRNFGLDLVRAIAITLVLLSHGRHFLPEFPNKILLANGGFFGVELFFVLSGFLIGTILIRQFEGQRQVSLKVVRDFWLRRWFRTIPNYALFLALNATVFQWLFEPRQFDFRYVLFFQNFMWPCPPLMEESWSLAVEEWFYFSLPLLMLAFLFLPMRKQRALLSCFVIYILSFSIIRFYGAFTSNADWDDGVRKIVLYRLDAIGYGVLVAYFSFYHGGALSKLRKTLLVLGGACLGLLVVSFSHSLLTTTTTVFNKTVLISMTSIGFALCLPWFQTLMVSHRIMRNLVSHVSIVSYSMYLIHLSSVIPFLRLYVGDKLPWYVVYVLFWLLTTVLSTVVYKYYERPFTRLRERFTERNRQHTGLGTPAQARLSGS